MDDQTALYNDLSDVLSAKGKRLALIDIHDLIEKYRHKLERQYTDKNKKFERLKNSDASRDKIISALQELTVLKCQSIEAIRIAKELVQRQIDVNDELMAIGNKYIDKKDQ